MPREIDSAAAHGGRPYATVWIRALDEPGAGGACHEYEILSREHDGDGHPGQYPQLALLRFQKGGIQEVGINGITHEALLAVIIDRLEHFQRGRFPCTENHDALGLLKAGLDVLNSRTHNRELRGVEGKSQA